MMVHPLHRLCQAVVPQMINRHAGKIVVFGSATALKGMPTVTAYSAARAPRPVTFGRWASKCQAQHTANLIAQNYVENPVYYPRELREKSPSKSLARQVPLGRLATAGRMRCLRCFWLRKKAIFSLANLFHSAAAGRSRQASHLFLVDYAHPKPRYLALQPCRIANAAFEPSR